MLQNYSGYRVLQVFMETPLEGLGLREICRRVKLGAPSVINYLKGLNSDGLIVEKKMYGKKFYFANRESRLFKLYKQFETLRTIEESGLLDYINEELAFPTVVLFGSKPLGEDTEKSDMDLLVITNSKKQINLEKYESVLKTKIHLMILSDDDAEKMKTRNRELFNNVVNGRVLSGYLKVF